ncbi:ABC transporter permease [Georgenia ruanii]|uniref:ABC transporter permease n=1 Tax=Georgenia ruanii TaxID=348442 RepID=UPI001D029697|nr:ABC transporter permease [Georgenia ruanii]
MSAEPRETVIAGTGSGSYATGAAVVAAPGTGPAGEASVAGTGGPDGPGAADAGRRPRRGPVALAGLLLPVALVAAWHVLSTAGVFSAVELPAPLRVLEAGADLLARGELWTHVQISTQRVLLGFAIGGSLGLALGALLGLSRWAEVLLGPTVGAFRAVPSLAWVPLLLIWIGIGEDSKVTLVAIGAFFPVFTTVSGALRHVDRHLVEAGRAFGLRGLSLLTTVQLPAVLPAIISGLRLALAQGWLFLVAAELIAASMGLGFLLTDSQNNGRTDRLLLAIVLLAVLGKLSDAVLGVFERWAIKKWA